MTEAGGPEGRSPRPAEDGLAERVSDADRDRAVTQLREHVAAGRLTLEEFSERMGLALEAHTRMDVEEALSKLPAWSSPSGEIERRPPRRWVIAVMSGSQARGRWRIGERTTAVAVMGGCDLDLRHAEIDRPDVAITAFAFWGGVRVTVPEGFDVDLGGFSLMGGRNLKLRDVPPVPGSPRIRIRGFAIMGGIDVRSRPSRPRGEIAGVDGSQAIGPSRGSLTPGGVTSGPIDAEAIRDIRDQIRAQRHADRQGSRTTRPSRTGQAATGPVPGAPSSGEGTVTILFSDMVDYAGITERLGDETSRDLLRAHHDLVRQSLGNHGGREIKVQGDGFMVAFGSVARALRCAAEMQRTFAAYSDAHGDRPIRVHIGVHTGEAMEENDDFIGYTVILASRLADAARPGEILVSSLSAQLVERTREFRLVDQRDAMLKGLTSPQGVATLDWRS